MKNSRFLLAALIVLMFTIQAKAQWATNGNDIYNTNSGNVGIGISTPLTDLHIYDGSDMCKITLESPHTGANRVIGKYEILNSATGDKLTTLLRLRNGDHEMVNVGYNAATSTYIPFQYVNYTTRKYEMRTGVADAEFKNTGNILFNNTGAIGVGTGATVPAGVKLAVNGKINCKEVEVTLSGWADYVLADDYKLRSLNELETYINQNKHLPDVPSEKEVLENGANIGEMNAILLKKIEELTLYVIELKKENEEIKSKVKELMK